MKAVRYSGSVGAIRAGIERRQAPCEHLLGKRIVALDRAPRRVQQVRFERRALRLIHARHDGGEGVADAAHMGVGGPGDGGGFGDGVW